MSYTKSRPIKRMVLLALIAILPLACLGDGIIGSSTVNGVYALRSINDASLPYTVTGSAPVKVEVIDDAITLFMGFTFSRSAHTRTTNNGQVTTQTISETGQYGLQGTSITLRVNENGASVLGNIAGNEMRIVDAGFVRIYKK